jgi:hypothetical protein
LPIILALIAIALVLWLAWETNFGNIRKWVGEIIDGLMNIFGGFMDFFQGIWDLILGIVTLDTEKIMNSFTKMGQGLYKIVVEGFGKILWAIGNFIFDSVKALFDWGYKLGTMIFDAMFWVGENIGSFFTDLVGNAFNWGKNVIDSIVRGLLAVGKSIGDTLWSLIPEPFRGWLRGGIEWVGGGLQWIGQNVANWFGFQHGGVVTRPTPAIIGEAGPEAVIPLNRFGGLGNIVSSPTFNITATISSDMDIRELASKLNGYWVEDIRRHIR